MRIYTKWKYEENPEINTHTRRFLEFWSVKYMQAHISIRLLLLALYLEALQHKSFGKPACVSTSFEQNHCSPGSSLEGVAENL